MLFAKNTTFTSISPSEFEAHVTSFHSINPRDFDSLAHKAAQEEDCYRSIYSKGASFIPTVAALEILELDAGVSIAEVACCIFPILSNIAITNFEAAIDWLQVSFTTICDVSYVSGPILT